MEVASIVLHQVIIMFMLLAVGVIVSRRGVLTLDAARVFSGLLLKIITPCVLIRACHRPFSAEKAWLLLLAFGLAVAFHFLAIFLSRILYKKDPENKYRIKQLGVVYSNCGFMGFPLLGAVFGEEGIFLGMAFFATFNIFMWIHGIKVLREGEKIGIKKIIFNPGLVATAIGLLTYFLRLNYPEPVIQAVEYLGSMNTPLAMVVTGVFLAEVSLREVIREKEYFLAALVRTLLMPFLFVLMMCLLRVSGWMAGAGETGLVIAICAACPAAATIVLLPASLNMDGTQGGKLLAVSTLLSLITLPVMTYISQLFLQSF